MTVHNWRNVMTAGCFVVWIIGLGISAQAQSEHGGKTVVKTLQTEDIKWEKTDYLVRGSKTVKQNEKDVMYAEIPIPESATMVNCPMMKTNEYVGIAFFDKSWNYMGCAYNRDSVSGTHFTYRIPNGAEVLRYSYRGFPFDRISFLADTLPEAPLSYECEEGDGYFRNPVISRDWPDPSIIKCGKRYYSLATWCRTVYESENMSDWRDMGIAPLPDSEREKLQKVGRVISAPDIAKVGSHYLLYLAQWTSNFECGIAVCKSSNPYGPYEFSNIVTSCKETGIEQSIDPEFVADNDGRNWLFFGSCGGIHRVELTKDGLHVKDNAKYVHVAGMKRGSKNLTVERIFEGAYLYKHKGYWYLFVSYGSYSANYGLKVGRSKKLTGEFIDKEGRPMKEGFGTVVLSSELGDCMFDPGHCGEIFKDKSGRTFMFYHSHVNGYSSCGKRDGYANRPMCLQEIFWNKDGWPYFEGGKPQMSVKSPKI